MDMVLVVLAASKSPILASDIGSLLSRDSNSVRQSLAYLYREGLATKVQVGSKGPQGTWEWSATESGKACAQHLLTWIRGQS